MSFSIGYHHTIDDCIYAELVVDPMSTYVRVRLGTDLTLFMSQEHAGQLAYALLNPVPEGVANPLAPPQCVLESLVVEPSEPLKRDDGTYEHLSADADEVSPRCLHLDLLPDEDVSEPPQALEVCPTIRPYTLDELKDLI